MTDVTGLRFGYCLPIFANPGLAMFRTPAYERLDPLETLRLGVLAEELGYDSLWVADHLMLGQDEAILEGWTTLSVLAGATSRARLGMIHQANLFRHPSMTAKMGATLDQLSGGRYIHFPDYGHNRREHVAYGLPWFDDEDERVSLFIDALDLTRGMWSGPGLADASDHRRQTPVCAPAPAQRPHPPIWLGEVNERVLDWCARFGQGWNTTPVSLDQLHRRLDALRRACLGVNRPFDEIEKSLEIQVLIAPDRETLRDRLRAIAALAPVPDAAGSDLTSYLAGRSDDLKREMAETWLAGTPDEVAARIEAYAAAGISHFLLWFVDAPSEDGLRLFAEQVISRYQVSVRMTEPRSG